jgi:hypothetical protein
MYVCYIEHVLRMRSIERIWVKNSLVVCVVKREKCMIALQCGTVTWYFSVLGIPYHQQLLQQLRHQSQLQS